MRASLFVIAIALASGAAACGGHREEVIEPSGPPPLPPASGSVIGYLVDAKAQLKLSDDQLAKLEKLDQSLAARNGQLDAQLRMMEQPVPAEQLTPQQMKAGVKPQRYNNAPGASTMATDDSTKVRKMIDDNNRASLKDAFAVLDASQQVTARRILQDRGVLAPDGKTASPPAGSEGGSDSGQPLPGMEP